LNNTERFEMSFVKKFPSIAVILGETSCVELDEHASALSDVSDSEYQKHMESCRLAGWCARYSQAEFVSELSRIDHSLAQIAKCSGIGEAGLRTAYSKKVHKEQSDQLLAEIVTASTCAQRAKLLSLEWMTGKKNYDADVRCEVGGQAISLEVTLRTDPWLEGIKVHLEDIFDDDGNQIADFPPAQTRKTLTDRAWSDLKEAVEEAGGKVALRPQDVAAAAKNGTRKQVFVSSPEELPENQESKAYCADGDSDKVESVSIQQCIISKAQKFNADGYHLVVLATMRPGFPSEADVFDAVFGQRPEIKSHGIFESGTYDEICGVILLPVLHQLDRLEGKNMGGPSAVLFPNHNAKCKLMAVLEEKLAETFMASIRRGWMQESPPTTCPFV
jgi:hypothetical protein